MIVCVRVLRACCTDSASAAHLPVRAYAVTCTCGVDAAYMRVVHLIDATHNTVLRAVLSEDAVLNVVPLVAELILVHLVT